MYNVDTILFILHYLAIFMTMLGIATGLVTFGAILNAVIRGECPYAAVRGILFGEGEFE
jgi:hypothetical protein